MSSLNETLIRAIIRGNTADAKNATGYTALMFAAEGDRRNIIEMLLERGVGGGDSEREVGDRNHYGETVLMSLARHGQTDLVQRLIDMGADIHATNKIGNTALYLAAENNHPYTVKVLIAAGGDVNTANMGGWTPLMMASARGDLETMSLLLENRADFHPKNRWGATALSEARKSFRSRQAVEMLMQAGAVE